ncbi:hypothetical protein D3C77_541900 [compost metagenome]
MLVQVCEHLLASVQTFIDKEQYRNVIVTQLRVFSNGLLDRCPSVLPIIDENRRFHGDGQGADALLKTSVRCRIKLDHSIHRRG